MITQDKLSLAQQAAGRKYWHIFNIFNAVSFACVADNVLYLFALEIGCPQYIIPLIASFMYIGFLAMPAGKLLVARIGGLFDNGLLVVKESFRSCRRDRSMDNERLGYTSRNCRTSYRGVRLFSLPFGRNCRH
ncbi:MAG: hypothetical protein WCS27_15605 [Victivallaceae bacterium]